MNLITCDPGDNTAIVFWSDMDQPVNLFFAHLTPKMKTNLSLAEKQIYLCEEVKKEFERLKYYYPAEDFKFIIEGVTLWGKSEKSQASATGGHLFRLAYIVGGLINTFHDVFPDNEIEVVSVQTWKGGLPTPVLEKEVERYIGYKAHNEHLACAIGIGMNHFGKLG